ncbi:MAG: hypothetical protein JWO44_1969 [Bacteroidetes bacterium]|nr:hypothetical protein [Bacteroidota bacterium]
MIDTTLTIGDFSIHEPVTAFTDYLITIIAFIYYWKLPSTNEVVKNWRLFFLFISLSTFFGGSSHALFAVHEGWKYKSLWLPMQFINGFAVYYAQKATLLSVLRDSEKYNAWKLSYIIQLVAYFIALIIVQKYIITIIDNAVGLVPIMILHLSAKVKEDYYRYIGYGIAVSFITAIVHGIKFSLHAYFNYNDIAHVFIMISLTVMFLGVRQKATSLP